MEWSTIARVLADRGPEPLAVLDRSGTVHVLNRAMEQLLGCNRFDALGRPWSEICGKEGTAEGEPPASPPWLVEALDGALRGYQVRTTTETGRELRLHLEFSLVGRGSEQALLITAGRVEPVPLPLAGGVPKSNDVDYDIARFGSRFGFLTRVHVDGEDVALPDTERLCYELLYGRAEPCDDCPLKTDPAQRSFPGTSVRHRRIATMEGTRTHIELVSAELIDEATARIRVRTITDHMLGIIREARVRDLAERAGLSDRERDVLQHLIMGRNTSDIAQALGITQRTVKYHQANILEKVGADSRTDLARFVL